MIKLPILKSGIYVFISNDDYQRPILSKTRPNYDPDQNFEPLIKSNDGKYSSIIKHGWLYLESAKDG